MQVPEGFRILQNDAPKAVLNRLKATQGNPENKQVAPSTPSNPENIQVTPGREGEVKNFVCLEELVCEE